MRPMTRTVYRCSKCPSEMTTNGAWLIHMASHLRLEQMACDLAKYGPQGVPDEAYHKAVA